MTTPTSNLIAVDYSPYIIFGASALGLLWGGWNTLQVRTLSLFLILLFQPLIVSFYQETRGRCLVMRFVSNFFGCFGVSVQVRKVELEAANVKPNTHEKDKEDREYAEMMPWDSQGCLERMEHINQLVKDVSHFPPKNTLFL